ncbi:hypothetical protein ABW19_dt0208707 [Dactylella cylindrospora]|nr:hypothetical protein ABW19_dt0208707 [Dactylella cylindrospora]
MEDSGSVASANTPGGINNDKKRKRSTSPACTSPTPQASTAATPSTTATTAPQVPSIPDQSQSANGPLNPASTSTSTPLSKNQQKKLLKKQKWEASRESRRAIRREKVAAKRARQREARMNSNAGPSHPANSMKRKQTRKLERRSKQLNIKCVVDCSFDDYMMDKEVASLGSQVSRCYSDNRIARFSMDLWLTCVDKRLKSHLNLMHGDKWNNWRKITITDKDYEFAKEDVEAGNIIYLSSDSDDTLETLDVGKTYIVGGIVDKNRHKGLCFNKAVGQGLRTARLPIGEYIRMIGRVALTTNQVVEIMLRWLELKDWQKAFEMVIPMRKKNKGPIQQPQGQDDGGIQKTAGGENGNLSGEGHAEESSDDEMENPITNLDDDSGSDEDDSESEEDSVSVSGKVDTSFVTKSNTVT